jgi:hypothetical protein
MRITFIAFATLLAFGNAACVLAQYMIPKCAYWAFGNKPGEACVNHHCIEPNEILFDEDRNLLIIAGEVRENDLVVSKDAFQKEIGGGVDLFVTIYSIEIGRAIYTSYIGGRGDEVLNSMEMMGDGRVSLAGYTNSAWFPSERGPNNKRVRGNSDGLYAIFNLDSLYFEKIDLFGSESIDQLHTVMQRDDRLYLFGTTSGTLPVTENAVMKQLNSGFGVQKADAFMVIIKDSAIEYCTYFGGDGDDGFSGAVLLDSIRIFMQLSTDSKDLPVTNDAISASCSQYGSAALVIFNTGDGLEYCSYISGDPSVVPDGHLMQKGDSIYLIGTTRSYDLPVTDNAWKKQPESDLIGGYFMVFNWNTHVLVYSTYITGKSYVFPFDIINVSDTNAILYILTECDSLGSFVAPDNGPAPNVWVMAADFHFGSGITDRTRLLTDPLTSVVLGVCDGGDYYYSTGYASAGLRVCSGAIDTTSVPHDVGFVYRILKDIPVGGVDIPISESTTRLIGISPNPTGSLVDIAFAGYPESGNIVIYNSNGYEVDRFFVNRMQSSYRLDISSYPKGVYFLRYSDRSGGTVMREKFVVMR